MKTIEDLKRYKQTHYYVSEEGKIYSNKKHGQLKELKPLKYKNGYHYVDLYEKGIVNRKLIHRIVGEVYVVNSNKKKYTQINHLDGCKSNNHYTNLEWTDNSNNMIHASKNNLSSRKLTDDDVRFIRKNYQKYSQGPDVWNTKTLAEKFGINLATVSRIILFKIYKWVK